MTHKRDFKKELKALYNPSAKDFSVVDVPPLNFLMIDGEGDPNTAQSYKDAVSALFSVAYTVKFAIKRSRGIDYGVMPLEGLWWAEDMAAFTTARDKSRWSWTLSGSDPMWSPSTAPATMRHITF